jgi:outer membrane protein OmpA-like peptidoglycan-associated protein
MKKIYLLLLAAISAGSTIAQQPAPGTHANNLTPRWAIDANLLGGFANQSFKTANTVGNYPDAVNANTGKLRYKNGYSYGANVQVGYFFDKNRHWGLGTGVLFMEQRGVATLNDFSIEYRANDAAGNIYRQSVKGNGIKEEITSSNLNIPVVLKYNNRFSKHWGFAVDGGALVNLQMKNKYTTQASFSQEAVYKFTQNSDGGTTSVYDNSPIPSADAWLITKAEFQKNNPNGNWEQYASIKRSMGINVGDGLSSGSRTGTKSYKAGSVGFMIQPSFSYYVSDNVALNLGGYYFLQPFKNDAKSGYRVTDGKGSYNSSLNNVTASTNHSYGLNVGARFFLGNKDRDHDGIKDRKDKCPDIFGLAKFQGCPDTDNDGVPDSEDSCATVYGLVAFHGCPDTDSDGITDREDACPRVAGLKELRGCPDRDSDGIADKDDVCPDVFGLAKYRGCPDTDGDGLSDNEDKCPLVAGPQTNGGCPVEEEVIIAPKVGIETPMLFEVNKSTLQPASISVIEEAVDELNGNKKSTIIIDGHADASGPESVNKTLSQQRANAVKEQLTQRGIDPKRLKTRGNGSKIPAASNETYEGKQQNRRAAMQVTPSKK